uniref:PDZ domain-containing protein n=1 Tax=Eucampia antarctica TaxID=49252 RepID=A0A7S2W2N0_9STRA
MTSEEALNAYGDRSMTSIDRDYKKAHYRFGGGASIKSMSSAGLTLGENTFGTYSYLSQAGQSRSSIFQDSLSGYSSNNPHSLNSKHYHEEIIHINAPPGKLGMSIDTPDDGVVVVHAVKSISPIVDQLQVGDRLLALDDEDIRFCTALKISKMISRKSNATRKLTIARSIPSDKDENGL